MYKKYQGKIVPEKKSDSGKTLLVIYLVFALHLICDFISLNFTNPSVKYKISVSFPFCSDRYNLSCLLYRPRKLLLDGRTERCRTDLMGR